MCNTQLLGYGVSIKFRQREKNPKVIHGSTVSLQQEDPGFKYQPRPFCMEFACFPYACMVSFQVLSVAR